MVAGIEFESGECLKVSLKLEGGRFDMSELEMCVPVGRHLGIQNLKANLYLQMVSDPTESHPLNTCKGIIQIGRYVICTNRQFQ